MVISKLIFLSSHQLLWLLVATLIFLTIMGIWVSTL